jgi:hypothetical protein
LNTAQIMPANLPDDEKLVIHEFMDHHFSKKVGHDEESRRLLHQQKVKLTEMVEAAVCQLDSYRAWRDLPEPEEETENVR